MLGDDAHNPAPPTPSDAVEQTSEFFEISDGPETPPIPPLPDVRVVTFLVTSGVTPYLHDTLDALTALTRAPEHVLIVDVADFPAESDGLDDVVADSGITRLAPTTIVPARDSETFGSAVAAALARPELAEVIDDTSAEQPKKTWFWLLHDDSAPGPDALAELVSVARTAPRLAVAGCKQRGWGEPDRLLQVGLSATRTARRAVEFDQDEIDQGQYDTRSSVLAVGSAGMLVDAEVWRQVEGMDPHLGPFGDGLELCRRVRLDGYEVRVVPTAVVHHARASYEGLRDTEHHDAHATSPHPPDPRRSYRRRRAAQTYNALLAATFVTFRLWGYLLVAPLRALVRLITKEPRLAAAEIGAALDLMRSRRAVRAGRRRIRAAQREERRHRRAVRAVRATPSELEIAERAALARSRRRWLTMVVLVLGVVGAFFSGHLLGKFPDGAAIAALPETVEELWRAARALWIGHGLGTAGPADPLLTVLTVFSLLPAAVGLAPSTTLVLLLVVAPLAAGVGAWYAAGAATRRVAIRAWVAIVWALSPTMVLALSQGRVGWLLAGAALPWVALSVAWVTGLRRRDLLLPGLVGARRRRQRPMPGPEAPSSAQKSELTVFADLLDEGEETSDLLPPSEQLAAGQPTEVEGTPAIGHESGSALTSASVGASVDGLDADGERAADAVDESQFEVDLEPFEAAPARSGAGHNASISVMAAAGGGFALALATAGVPALLPASILALLILTVLAPYGRRYLPLMALPPLALHLPVLLAASRTGQWRALLADTGVPFAVESADTLQALLGWPQDPASVFATPTLPSYLAGFATHISQLGSWAWGALIVLAVFTLLRTGGVAHAVRAAWLIIALGVAVQAVASRVVTGVGETASGTVEIVFGSGAAGTLLVTAGALAACALADGAAYEAKVRRRSLGQDARGVRRGARSLAAVCGVVLAVLPLLAASLQLNAAAQPTTRLLEGRGDVVPALSVQLAQGPEHARTLELSLAEDTLTVGLWRANGRSLAEASTLASAQRAAAATGEKADPFGDALVAASAQLAGGGGIDIAARLGELGVGVVLVPPVGQQAGRATVATATAREHDELVTRIDAVPGLERVTVNAAGTVWRVVNDDTDPAVSTARARITDLDGMPLADLPSMDVEVHSTVPAAGTDTAAGEGRLLVLAERADAGWVAKHDDGTNQVALKPRTLDDGRQAFELPAAAGTVHVTHKGAAHLPIDILQIVVFGITALLAVPVRRGRITV